MSEDGAKQFTSVKLHWINALICEPHISDSAKCFGVIIAGKLNAATDMAIVADDTLTDESGGFSRSKLLRCRKELVRAEYLAYRAGRGSKASEYRLRHEHVEARHDWMRDRRERRKELREERSYDRSLQLLNWASNAAEVKHKNRSSASNSACLMLQKRHA